MSSSENTPLATECMEVITVILEMLDEAGVGLTTKQMVAFSSLFFESYQMGVYSSALKSIKENHEEDI